MRGAGGHGLYPLTFRPVFKDYPWGGRSLATRFGRALPPGVVAESWEISGHPAGPTPVATGAAAGRNLDELAVRWGTDLLGTELTAAGTDFPVLIKLLDAAHWLSIQVHPDDAWARRHERQPGKAEAWVVLDAAPGAELILGVAAGVDRSRLAEALAAGSLPGLCRRVPARAGDVFSVPPGTVHAIGPGLVLAEIQQASDVTYRLYDWERQDAGRPRSLHLEQALAVVDLDSRPPAPVAPRLRRADGARREELVVNSSFRLERLTLASEPWSGSCDGRRFEIWGVLAGRAELTWGGGEPLPLAAVSWTLLPAALGEFRLRGSGATLLRVVPRPPRGAG